MKIYLIRTPEYKLAEFTEVHKLLNSFKGTMEFIDCDFKFGGYLFPFLKPIQKISSQNTQTKNNKMVLNSSPLKWDELFSICNYFRKRKKIAKSDFVVLLTSRKNEFNWFSHFDKSRNIFIDTGSWEHLNVNFKDIYPITYQVVENILQFMMKLDSTKPENKYIHIESIGCVNDLCENKRQVMLKLRTADICEVCFKRIKQMKIDSIILDQMFQIFEGLRLQFLFKKDLIRNSEPFSIRIDKNCKLLIPELGNKELILEPLFKSIYILFLITKNGIRVKELYKYHIKLKKIYSRLKPNLEESDFKNKIFAIINPKGNSFSEKKAKINNKIKNQLGTAISENFIISGKPSLPFKINLSKINKDIRF